MAVALPFTDLGAIASDDDLGLAANLGDGGLDLCLGDIRGADSCIFAIINEKNLVEDDLIAFFVGTRELLNRNRVALGDVVLLAAGLDDCKFHRGTVWHICGEGARACVEPWKRKPAFTAT